MKAYVFSDKGAIEKSGLDEKGVLNVLERVARTTDTDDLVVAVYLLNGHSNWKGLCKVGGLARGDFARKSRGWSFVKRFPLPDDLPRRFQLIRLSFGMAGTYPQNVSDVYGWEVHCPNFAGHLAYTFAHELHHFRRYHLRMHPGEGEQRACQWALTRMVEARFPVRGERVRMRRRRAPKAIKLKVRANPELLEAVKTDARRLGIEDLQELQRWTRERIAAARAGTPPTQLEKHMNRLRELPAGARVLITGDDRRGLYLGQRAVKVRTLRRSSTRMVIRTADGQEWRWPMQWLEPTR